MMCDKGEILLSVYLRSRACLKLADARVRRECAPSTAMMNAAKQNAHLHLRTCKMCEATAFVSPQVKSQKEQDSQDDRHQSHESQPNPAVHPVDILFD